MVTEYSLNQLTLKPASQAQTIEARKRSSKEWAKWMTLEEYLQRDEEAERLDHAKDGKLVTWVLVPALDTETLDFFCACETYQRNVYVLPIKEIKAVSAIGYGVASVFTPKKFRSKGYAARMMSLLHFSIGALEGLPAFPSAWGNPPIRAKEPGIVSVLYSDIGTYYARCAPGEGTGWTVINPTTTEWAIGSRAVDSRFPPNVEFLTRDEAIKTIGADAAFFKKDLELQGPSSRIHFGFQTTEEWCWFQMNRDETHPLYRSLPPTAWGVRMQHQGERHFIVWTYEAIPNPKIIIINIRASPETFIELFEALKLVAWEKKHEIIETWNLDKGLISTAENLGAHTYEREEHLSAIKWYGEKGDVVWFGNNKLHWC